MKYRIETIGVYTKKMKQTVRTRQGLNQTESMGRIWDLIVSVPDHCLSFYFLYLLDHKLNC